MRRVILVLDEPLRSALAEELEDEGVSVVQRIAPGSAPELGQGDVDAVLVPARRSVVTAELVAACDRAGARILALGDGESRLLSRYGVSVLPADADVDEIIRTLAGAPAGGEADAPTACRVIAVWGPHGAPGRTTVSVQLAAELARAGHRTALVDADTVAPAISLLLGLSDEAPGIAAACRRAELGGLDAAELTRIASTVETSGGVLEVLGGINRPARWPELGAERLSAALHACREWVDRVVIDVSAAFEADEEVTWDLAGPRRHAATTAALRCADEVIAIAAADPLGIARFLRDHAELRSIAAGSPVRVVVNKVRPGPLGIDARGQVRRTLERFAGITDVAFLPHDQRAADAALLHARPIAEITPRSPLATGIRRLASASDARTVTAGSSTGSSRAARWPRRARAAPAASRPGGDPAWPS